MIEKLLTAQLHNRAEVLSRPSPAPRKAGVYAWYFKEIPPGLISDGCRQREGLTLLYVGIAPRARRWMAASLALISPSASGPTMPATPRAPP